MADYTFPGEHMYQNLVLQDIQPDHAVDLIKEMNVVDGDVFVVSYPKTGTTWMEYLVDLIMYGEDTKESSTNLHDRQLFIECALYSGKTGIEIMETRPRPCVMKSHLPAWVFEKQLRDDKAKVIIVIRNPKDTLVSFYNFYRMNISLGNFSGTWDEFFELYKAKHLLYGDYFDWYSSWVSFLDRPNIHLVKYEDMKFKFDEVLNNLSTFLGKSLNNKQKEAIKQQTSFDSMKQNPDTNYEKLPIFNNEISPFFRKGTVSDWKNYFSADQSAAVDDAYQNQLADKVQLQFE